MDLSKVPHQPPTAILSACLLATLLAACATSPGVEAPTPRDIPLELRVRNENPMDVRVYALRGTAETRLGIVPTMRTEYFRIPAYVYRGTGSVQFKVDPIGGAPGYVTEAVLVHGIHRIDLRLEKPFAYSRILVQ